MYSGFVFSVVLTLPCFYYSFQIKRCHPFPTVLHHKLQASLSISEEGLENIAKKFRITTFGQGENAFYGLDVVDRAMFGRDVPVEISLANREGLGLDLIEVYKLPSSRSAGLVLIESVLEGGNAYAAGKILPGDALVSISSKSSGSSSLEGLNFEETVKRLKEFTSLDAITLNVTL